MLQATLVQFLFEIGMILKTSFVSDLGSIRKRKLDLKGEKDHRENENRKKYKYIVREKVLVRDNK